MAYFIECISPFASGIKIVKAEGVERLSESFNYRIVFHSEEKSTSFNERMHQEFTCRLGHEHQYHRFISGVIVDIQAASHSAQMSEYTVVLAPSLSLLKMNKSSAVFQNKSVPEVVCELLRQHGINNIELNLQETYSPLLYRIQYRETDYDFIHRLLEDAGIYYYFRHDSQGHTLILADHMQSHPDALMAKIPYLADAGQQDGWGVYDWIQYRQSHAEAVRLHGVDAQASGLLSDVQATASASIVKGMKWADVSGAVEKTELQDAARIKIQQLSARTNSWTGPVSAWWLACGERFELTHHAEGQGKYLIDGIHFQIANNSPESTFHADCQVTAMPGEARFYPPAVTAIPTMPGVVPALVVGPKSEEIYTDEQGRIKIQFFWDTEGKRDDSSSCWVRVAQSWAGNRFGACFIPRTGSEVLVSFAHGHPDYPLVTGSVYNGKNIPPFALPGDKNKSGFQSRSTPQGSVEQGNTLSFDDTKDSEELMLGAQRDLRMTVKNDLIASVDNEVKQTIGKGRNTVIDKGNESITLTKGDLMTEVNGGYQLSIKGGEHQLTVSGGGSSSKFDKACVIESVQSLTLKVGDSELVIAPTGIALKAATVTLQGKAMVDLKAEGVMQIDGSMVKIG